MPSPLTREELIAFKAKGMHIYQIAALTGIKPGTVSDRARALKVRFPRAKPQPERDKHPWRKHRAFAIVGPKAIAALIRNEQFRQERIAKRG